MSDKLSEITKRAAAEIHWHHVQPPDAYGQEDAARTAKIITRACQQWGQIIADTLHTEAHDLERLAMDKEAELQQLRTMHDQRII
jgi:hypothetical protein